MSWIKDLSVLVKETDIVNKVSVAIDAIAQKLNIAAVHVYEVFTKQVIAESIARIVLYGAYGTVCLATAILFWKMKKQAEWNHSGEPDNAYAWVQFISAIIFLGSVYICYYILFCFCNRIYLFS